MTMLLSRFNTLYNQMKLTQISELADDCLHLLFSHLSTFNKCFHFYETRVIRYTAWFFLFLKRKILTTFKGALSRLRQFLAFESPLKMIKNTFYFTLKALFILKIFKFLS